MYQNIPTKVLTGEVRLSYANLTTPRAVQQGQDAKYSVTLLIPKTDTATKANIDASIEAAAQDAQGKLWSGIRRRRPRERHPLRPGVQRLLGNDRQHQKQAAGCPPV